MSNPEPLKPTRIETHAEKSEARGGVHGLVPQDSIFSFRTQPVDLGRWSIIDIGVSLPRDPKTVFVQIKFPPNTDLSVSDNFSTVVSIATNRLIRVNVWRVDRGDNPSINYAFDVLITV